MPNDWYPTGLDALASWHQNFSSRLAAFQTKYSLTPEQVAQAAADNAWIQYWVRARHHSDNLRAQLVSYFNCIAGTDGTLDQPAELNFALVGTAPPPVSPGVELRAREIARHIKGHSAYAPADGELIGIIAAANSRAALNDRSPEFGVRTLSNFEIEVTFKRIGSDAVRFEYRVKGGSWNLAGYLTSSPGVLSIPTENTASQIELRAAFIRRNEMVGDFSSIRSAFGAAGRERTSSLNCLHLQVEVEVSDSAGFSRTPKKGYFEGFRQKYPADFG